MMGVHLSDDAYAVYRDLAAPKGMTVSEYLTDRAIAYTAQQTRVRAEIVEQSRTLSAEVARLHALGWDDGRISLALNKVRATVASTRRRLGLEPNKRNER